MQLIKRLSPYRIADLRVGWRAKPSGQALAAVTHLQPATLITGGSEGFGLALARVLAEEGRVVVLVARSLQLLMAATDSLKEEFPCARVELLELDVGLPNAVDVIDACLAKHGLYLDVLVNNAGVGVGGRFTALDPTRLEELIVTNVMAVSRLMRHFLPAMLARGRGGIMNLASLAAFAPGPWQHLILRARPTCCP